MHRNKNKIIKKKINLTINLLIFITLCKTSIQLKRSEETLFLLNKFQISFRIVIFYPKYLTEKKLLLKEIHFIVANFSECAP